MLSNSLNKVTQFLNIKKPHQLMWFSIILGERFKNAKQNQYLIGMYQL